MKESTCRSQTSTSSRCARRCSVSRSGTAQWSINVRTVCRRTRLLSIRRTMAQIARADIKTISPRKGSATTVICTPHIWRGRCCFGAEIEAALLVFQKDDEQEQDGSYGDKTHAALITAVADDDEGKKDDADEADDSSDMPPITEEPEAAIKRVVIVSGGDKVTFASATARTTAASAPSRRERLSNMWRPPETAGTRL